MTTVVTVVDGHMTLSYCHARAQFAAVMADAAMVYEVVQSTVYRRGVVWFDGAERFFHHRGGGLFSLGGCFIAFGTVPLSVS